MQNIFNDSMHEKRQKSLASVVLGIISSASLIVNRIGLVLAKAKKLFGKYTVKQVDHLLSNKKLQLPTCFEKTVSYIVGGRKEIMAVMDWTDFDVDKQATLMISLVTSHGRATPLVRKTVKAIPLVWPNGKSSTIDTGFSVRMPRGTVVHVGDASQQGGIFLSGTRQIVVEKPTHIPEVEVGELSIFGARNVRK